VKIDIIKIYGEHEMLYSNKSLNCINIYKELQKEKSIYIYGAGDWGHRFFIWCCRHGISVKNILVSDTTVNFKEVFGCKVVEYDSIENDRMSMVVVAINSGHKVCEILKNKGYENVVLLETLPDEVRDNEYFKALKRDEYTHALKQWFKNTCNQKLNLENPTTFNEKIQWIKLYGNHREMAYLADKYTVRQYVEKKIGNKYLIELFGVWDRFDDIEFSKLPNQFVLKCNHGCGYNIVVKDKSKFSIKKAKEKIEKWMNEDYGIYGFELHYSQIPHKIIAEEYIEQVDGGLFDYKIHCFKGIPKFVEVIGERDIDHHIAQECVFDLEWNCQNWTSGVYPRFIEKPKKPRKLDEMIQIAKQLSYGINYARIDLYIIGDNIKFGEITLTPGAGAYLYGNGWNRDIDLKLGSLIMIK